MSKIIYNKLIRDNILEIIEKSNGKAEYKILENPTEILTLLKAKLQEEVTEVVEASTESELMLELADVLEVIYRIAELKGVSMGELEKIRLEKRVKRGGFEKNIFLESVEIV